MAYHLLGQHLLADLRKALGIDQDVTKIVIEVEVNRAAQVYVRGLLDASQVPSLLGILEVAAAKDVQVADDCTVSFVPLDAVRPDHQVS